MKLQSKDALNALVQQCINALGPTVDTREIELNGQKFEFAFRAIPYLEMDNLRLHAIDPATGKFSKALHLGNGARLVAASLIDDTGAPFTTAEDVFNWPTALVDKLIKAAQEVNGLNEEAKEEIAKKSETTQSVA